MIRTAIISDLGRIVTGNTPPRNQPELYGDYTPFIKATDISENEKHTYLPEEGYSESGHKKYIRSLIPKGSTCVVTIGSIGKKMTMAHCDCFINQAMNAIIPNEHFDNEYVYYAVKNVIGNLKALDSGTASGRENVSKSAFSKMEVTITDDIISQRKIGSILAAYDDLIENNQKQIKLLEEAAQRLYKEWFVDLRFPGHEHTKIVDGVPEGWDYIPLGKTISYEIGGGWGEDFVTGKNECPGFVIRGTDIDDIKKGNLLSIPYRFHVQGNLLSRKLQDGDIIFEVSGGSKNAGVAKTLLMTESLLSVWKKPVICASFCKLIRFDKPHISQYIYDCLQYWRTVGETQEYEKKSASNIINYRWKEFLKQKSVLIPEQGLLLQYVGISSSLYKQAITCSIAISKAMQARDCLLPKLMSGEVEV